MIGALIPVKNFSLGKTRLADVLTPAERERLSAFMLRHVLQTLSSVGSLDLCALVTSDERAAQIGREYGCEIFWEKRPKGLNGAVDWATAICQSFGMKTLLVLPSDLPFLQRPEIDKILAWAYPESGVVICPSKEGTGTNALLRTPPKAIPAHFGTRSFDLHCQEAQRRGLRFAVLSLSGIAFDIDTPEDLQLWKNASEPSLDNARGIPFLVPRWKNP